MSRKTKREVRNLIRSVENPALFFKCSNCGDELRIPHYLNSFCCPHCIGGIMIRQDIVEFTGVPEIDNKLADDYRKKYRPDSIIQALDNLDIENVDSTEWMML